MRFQALGEESLGTSLHGESGASTSEEGALEEEGASAVGRS
jgi:hypothetical protein